MQEDSGRARDAEAVRTGALEEEAMEITAVREDGAAMQQAATEHTRASNG